MAESKSLEILAGTALIMLVFETNKAYIAARPSPEDLRNADPDDPKVARQLVDAGVGVAIPAILAGAAASWVMRSWTPLLVAVIACVAIGGYNHALMALPAQSTTT